MLALNWHPRYNPLKAGAVAARDGAAQELARRLLAREDEALEKLSGVAGKGVLILLGEADFLPWADGAIYLGHETATPALWLPTTLAPSAPMPLVERALRNTFPTLKLPVALVPQWNLALPLGAAQMMARTQLERFLEGIEAS